MRSSQKNSLLVNKESAAVNATNIKHSRRILIQTDKGRDRSLSLINRINEMVALGDSEVKPSEQQNQNIESPTQNIGTSEWYCKPVCG
jgi:hypothetical protein